MERGVPIAAVNPEKLRELPYVTAGTGSVAVLNRPPHPNAARVYLNWLLSRDGQTAWSKAVTFASLRQDVPRDHVDPYVIPKPGVPYLEQHREASVNMKDRVDDFIDSFRFQ
jgi:iron(III) transport system substrate-binding protein